MNATSSTGILSQVLRTMNKIFVNHATVRFDDDLISLCSSTLRLMLKKAGTSFIVQNHLFQNSITTGVYNCQIYINADLLQTRKNLCFI